MLVLKRKTHTAIVTDSGIRLEVTEVGLRGARFQVRGTGGDFALTLGVGDSVKLDGHIKVILVGIELGAVKLGVEAPKSIRVLREELVTQADRALQGTIWQGQ